MKSTIRSLFVLMLCLLTAAIPVFAAEVESGSTLCFTSQDFSQEETLSGICVLSLPETDKGTMLLGNRVLQAGDILTADQLSQVTFRPVGTSADKSASLSYLPVFHNHVAPETTMVISIRGKADQAPVAEDDALETYKNLTLDGKLKVSDPENEKLTFTVTRQPRRGEVTISDDGSFTYAPKKNKVGVDSFVFTATDEAGNVSREATVTIRVLRPTDSRQYTDANDCSFYAEWMKNTGIFTGEEVGGQICFCPDAEVSRGQFLVMAVKALKLPVEDYDVYSAFAETYPGWVSGYMPAVLRCGLLNDLPSMAADEVSFPITGAEAAVILQNALQLIPPKDTLTNVDAISEAESNPLAWAQEAMETMAENGMDISGDILTRGEAAKILYQATRLAETAPGISRFR